MLLFSGSPKRESPQNSFSPTRTMSASNCSDGPIIGIGNNTGRSGNRRSPARIYIGDVRTVFEGAWYEKGRFSHQEWTEHHHIRGHQRSSRIRVALRSHGGSLCSETGGREGFVIAFDGSY